MKIAQRATQKAAWCLHECAPVGAVPRVVSVGSFPFLVGRLPQASFCLPVPSVSKEHAELALVDGRLRVRDLGSTNGTFVNDERVTDSLPLREGDLLRFATEVFRVQKQESDAHLRTVAQGSFAAVESLCQLDRLMSDRSVTPYFQPIVRLADAGVVGYEMLARSRVSGLETPGMMFRAAERLGQEVALSVMLRREGVIAGRRLPGRPLLFFNTHPKELASPELLASLAEMRELEPDRPLAIEVHEAAITDERALFDLRQAARQLDMRLAYDDFGVGQARLDELARVQPDYVKFDMRLVRDLDRATAERRLVTARLVELVRELAIVPLAEGVETEREAAACREIGFELAQGYYFGGPAPPP